VRSEASDSLTCCTQFVSPPAQEEEEEEEEASMAAATEWSLCSFLPLEREREREMQQVSNDVPRK